MLCQFFFIMFCMVPCWTEAMFSDEFLGVAVKYISIIPSKNCKRYQEMHALFGCDDCQELQCVKIAYENGLLSYMGSIPDEQLKYFAQKVQKLHFDIENHTCSCSEKELYALVNMLAQGKRIEKKNKLSPSQKRKMKRLEERRKEEDPLRDMKIDLIHLKALTSIMEFLSEEESKYLFTHELFLKNGIWCPYKFFQVFYDEALKEQLFLALERLKNNSIESASNDYLVVCDMHKIHVVKIRIVECFKKILFRYLAIQPHSSFYTQPKKIWKQFSTKKKYIDASLRLMSILAKEFLTKDQVLITMNDTFLQEVVDVNCLFGNLKLKDIVYEAMGFLSEEGNSM